MESKNGEHTPKRFRQTEEKEPASIRCIKLDMKKYDSSVQAYSDEDLVKIFEFGLQVKESASLNLDVNKKIMEDALNSKLKPIHETVESFKKNLSDHLTSIAKNWQAKLKEQPRKYSP